MKKSRLFKINTGDLATTPSSFTTITGMSPHLCGRSSKRNEEGSKSADPVERSRHICQQYFRNYYKKNNRLPSFDEYRRFYRSHPSSTGEETEKAVRRLQSVYDYCRDDKEGFDPQKLKKGLYTVGEFIENLKENISQEELNQIVESETNYGRKVTIEDMDVALGYYFVNLMKNKEKKEFSQKELTVPANDITKWFKILKEEGEIKRSCNRGKARAMRIILQKIGYLECLDSYYSTQYKVSQRWAFTPKIPRYKEFVDYVGQETIDKVRKEGQEYVERKEKSKSRKQVA